MKRTEADCKPSWQEELQHLKRVTAGQKGKMTQLANELSQEKDVVKEQKNLVKVLQSQVASLKQIIAERNEELRDLQNGLTYYKSVCEYFKELPWYKRIFYKG